MTESGAGTERSSTSLASLFRQGGATAVAVFPGGRIAARRTGNRRCLHIGGNVHGRPGSRNVAAGEGSGA
jgi:hypothetical protein